MFTSDDFSVTIGEVDHMTLSNRENAVICKIIDFSLVNDEFPQLTFPIGMPLAPEGLFMDNQGPIDWTYKGEP